VLANVFAALRRGGEHYVQQLAGRLEPANGSRWEGMREAEALRAVSGAAADQGAGDDALVAARPSCVRTNA